MFYDCDDYKFCDVFGEEGLLTILRDKNEKYIGIMYETDLLPSFENASHIKELDASFIGLEQFPEIGKQNKLINLEVSGNELMIIPPLQHFTKIKKLNINENELKCIPSLHDITSLNSLFIGRNKLEQLSEHLTVIPYVY